MRILIVGGGIAGLATARALRLRGLDGEIVERDETWNIAGAGVYIPGNGMAALDRLGLGDAVRAHGAVVERRRLYDEQGRPFIDFDEAGFWRDVGAPVALHRRELHDVLAEGASGIPIRFGTTIRSLDDRGDVDIGFSDGTSGQYDLVIGADGIHSWMRTTVVGGPRAIPAGQVGWRYVLDGHPEIAGWNGWLARDRAFLALAIGGGRIYCYADVRSNDAVDPTGGDPSRLAALLGPFTDPVPALLAEMPPASEVWFSPIKRCRPRGRRAVSSSSAMRRTPARRTWRRARPWPSRTPWCWRSSCRRRATSRRPCRRSESAGRRASPGSRRRPTAATDCATSRRWSATSRCAPPATGSSGAITGPCSHPRDGASDPVAAARSGWPTGGRSR